jgi:hypothetical protein
MTENWKHYFVPSLLLLLSGLSVWCGFHYQTGFFALALALAFMSLGTWESVTSEREVVLWTVYFTASAMLLTAFGFLCFGQPFRAEEAALNRSFARCIASAGSFDQCFSEAKAIRGHERKYVIDVLDWRHVYPACKERLGVAGCGKALAALGVDVAPFMAKDDAYSLCPTAAGRSGCLLDLSLSGFPLRDLPSGKVD